MPTSADVPRTARERARAEITGEILGAARVRLAHEGATALSLRAVARDVGMVSSAVYRYVPNRDALLTMLIVDAYDSLGAAVEKAEAAVPRPDALGRFMATCHAVRAWALANPHEYALIYGSPVPGYAAPVDTIAPASRVPNVLVAIIVDLTRTGRAPEPDTVPAPVAASVEPVLAALRQSLSADLMLRGLAAWSTLFGTVSFELFGHLHNVVASGPKARKAYFDEQMRRVASGLGLAPAAR
ncbi:MAG: TetR/AcrR family transcriptional regulator [Candidatus Nanopelagicales bacterium]